MKTTEIAPGSILQRMYLKSRLRKLKLKDGRFLEIGAGTGYISRILLKKGLKGIGLDLNIDSCEVNREINKDYISQGSYEVSNANFFELEEDDKFDLIISSMVIEHLDENQVQSYFNKCKSLLKTDGVIITLVPSSMKYWGIEDEIAGHYKRYSFDCFREISKAHDLKINKNVGLTYPLSNMVFRLSNFLVRRAESQKENLSMQEKTVKSSNRKVMYKTNFPIFFRLFLNEITLFPLHVLQKLFASNKNAMVIYNEMKKGPSE